MCVCAYVPRVCAPRARVYMHASFLCVCVCVCVCCFVVDSLPAYWSLLLLLLFVVVVCCCVLVRFVHDLDYGCTNEQGKNENVMKPQRCKSQRSCQTLIFEEDIFKWARDFPAGKKERGRKESLGCVTHGVVNTTQARTVSRYTGLPLLALCLAWLTFNRATTGWTIRCRKQWVNEWFWLIDWLIDCLVCCLVGLLNH